MGFDQFKVAVEMRDIIRQMVAGEIDKQRPRLQYATVISVDTANRQANVLFPGESTQATVTYGSIVPATAGQVVRIEGVQGDRYIADVMGPDAKANVYEQPTEPTGLGLADKGDIWIDNSSDTRIVSVWDGTQWVNLKLASQDYVISRGTDYVTNGLGSLGDNYNFSGWTYDVNNAPSGVAAAFTSVPHVASVLTTDEYMAVDPAKEMKLTFKAIQLESTAGGGFMFSGVVPYDAYKLIIGPQNVMYVPSTKTTLAVALNPGATTITLTSSANWYGSATNPAGASTHLRSIIWWDYVDPGGKAWPADTYSRNCSGSNYWADGGITGNVITLAAPYSGPVRPAGTKLSNGSAGGTFAYGGIINGVVPTSWTEYSATIKGIAPSGTAPTMATGWPISVAYAQLVWLTNRTAAGANDVTSKHSIAAISFSDAQAAASAATAASAAANAAQATANGKNKVTYSTSTPGSTPNTAGDIWFQRDGTSHIIAQYEGLGGTSWTPRTLSASVISSLDAGVITVGTLSGIEIVGNTVKTSASGSRWEIYDGGAGVALIEGWHQFGAAPGQMHMPDDVYNLLPCLDISSPALNVGDPQASITLASGNGAQLAYINVSHRIFIEPTFTAPTLTNSWVNYGSGVIDAGYIMQPDGGIRLRGVVKNGTLNTAIFTLPPGYRPIGTEIFLQSANDATEAGSVRIDVLTTGQVRAIQYMGGATNAHVSLCNIVFYPF